MHRARPTYLGGALLALATAQQFQHRRQTHLGARLTQINQWHAPLPRKEQRRGTRPVLSASRLGRHRLAPPEAVLVEGLGFAPQVVDGPRQLGGKDGQRLALAALLLLLLLPL